MVKLKVIDFLEMSNKPEKFKYKNYIWEKKFGTRIYFNDENIDFESYLASVQICDLGKTFLEALNDEVEIVEDNPKLDKLSYQQIGSWHLEQHDYIEYSRAVDKQIKQLGSKVNEIIEKLNYLLEKDNNNEIQN